MKKRSFITILLLVCMLFCSCASDDTKSSKETQVYTGNVPLPEEEEVKEYPKVTVMESENFIVDSHMFAFMYFSNLANYILPYAEYYGILPDQPLSQQMYSPELRWDQYLYNLTESNIKSLICVAEYARSRGHEFPDIDKFLDEQIELWKGYAEDEGISFEEYLHMYFGESVSEEDVRNTFALQFYSYSYNDVLANEARQTLNEEYYESYFAENSDKITQTGPSKNVCHILFKTDTYGSEDAAKAKAEEVLELYKAGEQTQAAFEALGKEYTEDSSTYYENVPKGKMVEEFENWIYDESRSVGDTGLVLTTYGYHIMYFAGDGVIPWRSDAEEKCVQDHLAKKTEEYSSLYSDSIKVSDSVLDELPDIIPTGYTQ